MDQDCLDATAISGTQNSEAIKKEWKAQMFRCLSPQNPLICDEKDCMRSFPPSWCHQECPTLREMVNADFYYKGSGDRVLCFILVKVCFTGNRMTILGTNMKSGPYM